MTVLAEAIKQNKLDLAQHTIARATKRLVDAGVDREIAWAAGFLEGEGSFFWGVYPGSKNRGDPSYGSPRVTCGQADTEPLERLSNMFGGTIHKTKQRVDRKPFWIWSIYANDSIATMILVLPYMSQRRRAKIDEIADLWRKRLDREAVESEYATLYCPHGHARSEHEAFYKSGSKRGRRYCRTCSSEQSRAWYLRKRGSK